MDRLHHCGAGAKLISLTPSTREADLLMSNKRPHLSSSGEPDNHLMMEDVDMVRLAQEFGTPLYVMSETRIRERYRAFLGAVRRHCEDVMVCFACKANDHLAVCRILANEGAGAEVASGGELFIALRAGVPPSRIVFDGPGKSDADIRYALQNDIALINADSPREIQRIAALAVELKTKATVGLRINPGISVETHPHLSTARVDAKFGTDTEQWVTAFMEAKALEGIELAGLHVHLGSDIAGTDPLVKSVDSIVEVLGRLSEAGIQVRYLDLGGGLGISYEQGDTALSVEEYASSIIPRLLASISSSGLVKPKIIFEPGRWIVADSGILLATVNAVKRARDINWAIVDAGMNCLIRPVLYGARHEIVLANDLERPHSGKYNVGGPCCESGDYIALGAKLPELQEGDLLAVLDVGAYGFTMSSNYNALPRPAVVLVKNGLADVIRRREQYADLVQDEIVPGRL